MSKLTVPITSGNMAIYPNLEQMTRVRRQAMGGSTPCAATVKDRRHLLVRH